jgi:hypothetical protein
MIDVSAFFTPLLGHVAGVPVEETLPGVLAIGALSARLATDWLRRRLGRRDTAEKPGVPGSHAG